MSLGATNGAEAHWPASATWQPAGAFSGTPVRLVNRVGIRGTSAEAVARMDDVAQKGDMGTWKAVPSGFCRSLEQVDQVAGLLNRQILGALDAVLLLL